MKTYSFDPYEFALILTAFNKVHAFMHARRTEADLKDFQKEYYGLIKHANYDIILEKVSDDQLELISDVPIETEEGDLSDLVEFYRNVFSK